MSLTIKRVGAALEVLAGLETLPEGETLELFTAGELSELHKERLEWLEVQMPSFLRGDEDEDATVLFDL
jgi:hypothetical protein